MRLVNHHGRAALVVADGLCDVARASSGRFPAEPAALYAHWPAFRDWAAGVAEPTDAGVDAAELGAPSPEPRQVFAIGINYRDHAAETATPLPERPPVFTKFPTSITGPVTDLVLPSETVDWEVELVVVIGVTAQRVPAERAWEHVAGLTVGQDFSERGLQLAGPVPQFSLGKSYPGFGPTGPALVTVDELADPDDLAVACTVNGEHVQKGRTSQMVFGVPELIARLSAVAPLLPGDLIFTGTPAGVGMARTPRRFLRPGDEVVTSIEGLGALHTRCLPAA